MSLDLGSPSRRVFGGAALLSLAAVVAKFISLPAAPFLTRTLGPSAYGVAAVVGTTTALSSMIALMGLDVSYTRYSIDASGVGGGEAQRFCFRLALGSALVVAALTGLGYFLFAAPSLTWSERLALSGVVAWGTVAAVGNAMAMAHRRILGGFGRIAAATTVSSVVGLAAIVCTALYWRTDAWPLLIGGVCSTGVMIAVLGVPVRSLLLPTRLSLAHKRELVGLGIACTATGPGFWIMSSSDRWFLVTSCGESCTGIYNYSFQLAIMAQFVPAAVGATWLPEIARIAAHDNGLQASIAIGRLWSRVAGLYLITWVAVSLLGGEVLRFLTAPTFHSGAGVIPLIAAGVVGNGFVQLGMSGLVMAKRAHGALIPTAVAAAVSLGLNAVLVPRYGLWGAATSYAASFAVLGTLLVWLGHRAFPVRTAWKRLAALSLPAVALVMAGWLPWAHSPVVSAGLKVCMVLAFGALSLAILAPDWARRALDILSARGKPPRCPARGGHLK